MKKILGLVVMIALGLSLTGCVSSTKDMETEDSNNKIEEPAKKEDVEENEEDTQEVINVDNEEFKNVMTTTLTDEAYKTYFDSIEGCEVEFDGSIDSMQLLDGKKTRMELLLTYGDYSETSVTGPYMKVEDIAYGEKLSREILDAGTNVKVKAKIVGYDMDKSYLILDIISIERR